MLFKADMHLHSGEDPIDKLEYSAKELIDTLAKRGFLVASITNHSQVFFNKEIEEYAKSKGITLIPGAEIKINGKEILIYNITEEERLKIKSYHDLRVLRNEREDVLIVAPHPFFITSQCLGNVLEKNVDVFQAVEFSFFYHRLLNRNKKAVKFSKTHRIPLLANSDCHSLWQIGGNYSMIEAENKSAKSIIKAIKQGKVKIKTRPLPTHRFIQIFLRFIIDKIIFF